MVSTLDEIGKINSEIVDTRRKFRWHWKVLDIHVELSNRIIRFAVHSLKHHKAKAFETLMPDLFSGSVSSELTVCLHCKYMTIHPPFEIIREMHPEIVSRVGCALNLCSYGEGETFCAEICFRKFPGHTVHSPVLLDGTVIC